VVGGIIGGVVVGFLIGFFLAVLLTSGKVTDLETALWCARKEGRR